MLEDYIALPRSLIPEPTIPAHTPPQTQDELVVELDDDVQLLASTQLATRTASPHPPTAETDPAHLLTSTHLTTHSASPHPPTAETDPPQCNTSSESAGSDDGVAHEIVLVGANDPPTADTPSGVRAGASVEELWDKATFRELRDMCRARALAQWGSKRDLAERLEATRA